MRIESVGNARGLSPQRETPGAALARAWGRKEGLGALIRMRRSVAVGKADTDAAMGKEIATPRRG